VPALPGPAGGGTRISVQRWASWPCRRLKHAAGQVPALNAAWGADWERYCRQPLACLAAATTDQGCWEPRLYPGVCAGCAVLSQQLHSKCVASAVLRPYAEDARYCALLKAEQQVRGLAADCCILPLGSPNQAVNRCLPPVLCWSMDASVLSSPGRQACCCSLQAPCFDCRLKARAPGSVSCSSCVRCLVPLQFMT